MRTHMEADLYEADEHRWIEAQIAALCTGQFDRLDREHLIEYRAFRLRARGASMRRWRSSRPTQ
jgi:hypothetical protein